MNAVESSAKESNELQSLRETARMLEEHIAAREDSGTQHQGEIERLAEVRKEIAKLSKSDF